MVAKLEKLLRAEEARSQSKPAAAGGTVMFKALKLYQEG